MPNSTFKIWPALMIAIAAALVTQPMRAAVSAPTLVITENSSTSLTALLNGITFLNVAPNGTDNWVITLTGVGVSSSGGLGGDNWVEPDVAGGFINDVNVDSASPNHLFVRSDLGPGFMGALANNTTDTRTFTLNGSPLYVTFNDLGDVATVPDTGTTASLLGLSLTGLAFLRRKL